MSDFEYEYNSDNNSYDYDNNSYDDDDMKEANNSDDNNNEHNTVIIDMDSDSNDTCKSDNELLQTSIINKSNPISTTFESIFTSNHTVKNSINTSYANSADDDKYLITILLICIVIRFERKHSLLGSAIQAV